MEQPASVHALNTAQPTACEACAQPSVALPPARPPARITGWTPERQRAFCEALADCGVVRDAAAAAGMTVQSAYELRRRPEGKAFALAWAAALLIARPRLVDLAIERAVDGNVEQYAKEGVVAAERRRQDVRHLLAAIGRLDNIGTGNGLITTIADDFDAFLDCMEAEAQASLALSVPGAAVVKGRGSDKEAARASSKAAQSPLRTFFEEHEYDPALAGQELDALLSQLSRAKSPTGHKRVAGLHAYGGKADDSSGYGW